MNQNTDLRYHGEISRGDILYVGGDTQNYSAKPDHAQQIGPNGRPCIVVGNNKGNKYSPTIQVVYLTTKNKTWLPTHVRIDSSPRPSTALCENIDTIDKARFISHVGRCTDMELKSLDKALGISIGLQTQNEESNCLCLLDSANKQIDRLEAEKEALEAQIKALKDLLEATTKKLIDFVL